MNKSTRRARVTAVCVAAIGMLRAAGSGFAHCQDGDPPVPPQLAPYPRQTAIAGVPFTGVAPTLAAGTGPLRWALVDAPPGMAVDPETGAPEWPSPAPNRDGCYFILLVVTNGAGADSVEWVLKVVPNLLADAQLYSSEHVDFVVPPDIAAWMHHSRAALFVDAAWERMRDVIGQEPRGPKQVVQYDPSRGGGAVSGNPVYAGPAFWSVDPAKAWCMGAWLHEVGHNFHFEIQIGDHFLSGNRSDEYYHHLMEFTQCSIAARALQGPATYGLEAAALESFRQHVREETEDRTRRAQAYDEWLRQGGRASAYAGDKYGAWAYVCRELCGQFGPEVLENALRAMRPDGLPESVYPLADTPLGKDTLLFCTLSCAAGTDLRAFFVQRGFDLDDRLYDRVLPTVEEAMGSLPREDADGWKACPLNGHRYRLSDWEVHWHEGENQARKMGGHLATVRSRAEEEWLRSRFGPWRTVWIGLSDEDREGEWGWTSGETPGYADWNPGEPNGGVGENHAAMNWGGSGWNDANTESTRLLALIETAR